MYSFLYNDLGYKRESAEKVLLNFHMVKYRCGMIGGFATFILHIPLFYYFCDAFGFRLYNRN
ncbi:hypothetical protein AB669_03040 [Pedobacter sp. BMA]|nr:hypothetical protein AB669_03040 [Pedobacter sp. BMA]